MSERRIGDAQLAARDAIYSMLLVRKGEVLTEELCRERAANGSYYVIEALRDLAEASKRAHMATAGEINADADARARAVPNQDVIAADRWQDDEVVNRIK